MFGLCLVNCFFVKLLLNYEVNSLGIFMICWKDYILGMRFRSNYENVLFLCLILGNLKIFIF